MRGLAGASPFVATIEGRFATRKYHAPAAITTSRAEIAKASGAGARSLLRLGRLGLERTSDAARRGLRDRRHADLQRICPDRLRDVLELRRAEIGDREIEPPLHLPVGVLGQTDRARRGDALQSRGDVDAVAHQVAVALLDDVAEMNADAKDDAAVLGHAGVAFDHRVLHFDCAAHRVDHAAELDDRPSPVRLTSRPLWTAIVGIDQFAAQRPQPRQDAILVSRRRAG